MLDCIGCFAGFCCFGRIAFGVQHDERNGKYSESSRGGCHVCTSGGGTKRGEPGAFYLEGKVVRKLLHADGVADASPQLFIATYDSVHCAFPTQIIGYEPSTDFVIGPWLSKEIPGGPQYGEVVVGYSVNRSPGDDILLFNRQYKVVAKLDKTGMGFDTSLFIDMDTARDVLEDYASYSEAEYVPEGRDVASSIVVNIEDGYDPARFAKHVRDTFREDNVGVVLSQTLIGSISENLEIFLTLMVVSVLILWGLAVGVIAGVFAVTLNERKREFGILKALGATEKQLSRIVLAESSIIGLSGTLIGMGVASLVVFPFRNLIEKNMETAFLQPSASVTLLIFSASFVISFLTGPLASVSSARKARKAGIDALIREGE